MKKKHHEYNVISGKIRKRYIPAVILIVVLVFIRQTAIEYQLNHDKSMATVINIAGNQRMLSQKITKDALEIYSLAVAKDDLTVIIADLKDAIEIWEQSGTDLQNGNPQKGIPGNNSYAVSKFFSDIEDSQKIILNASNDIIYAVESENYSIELLKEKVELIKDNEGSFLNGMNNIVVQYSVEYTESLRYLDNLEFLLFVLILGLILFEVLFIFIPTEKHLNNAFVDVNEAKENILRLFKTIHGPLFLIEEENFEIILDNEDGELLIEKYSDPEHRMDFSKLIDNMSLEGPIVVDKIRSEEKLLNYELIIDKTELKKYYILSTAQGEYNGNKVILISFSDITYQKQVEETIRKRAFRDELTGLYNRHFMDEIVDEEIQRSERYNFPTSVFIMDLDHFKNVNDRWGHPVGDLVLKKTAQIASENIRISDFLIRLGGEEFLLIMPHTNLRDGVMVAEKIRSILEDYVHSIAGTVTASFGVAQRKRKESFQELYQRADAALYRAKNEGRNCVVADQEQILMSQPELHFNWRDQWNSGNTQIDEQHQQIIETANSLINLSTSNLESEEIMECIDSLLSHISHHFETEEDILKNIGYTDSIRHAMAHKALIQKAAELKISYLNGDTKLSSFFSFVIDEVVVGHMLDLDTRFFPFLEKK